MKPESIEVTFDENPLAARPIWRTVRVPDVVIPEDRPEYVYRACAGYGFHVLVEDIDGQFVGFMLAESLPGGPFDTVLQWMVHEGIPLRLEAPDGTLFCAGDDGRLFVMR